MSFRDEDFGKELVSAILTVDGLILTLAWSLFDWDMPCPPRNMLLSHLKYGSAFLVASLFLGLLCFQFMISASHPGRGGESSVMLRKSVGITFLFCWVLFLVGILVFLTGIWRIQ